MFAGPIRAVMHQIIQCVLGYQPRICETSPGLSFATMLTGRRVNIDTPVFRLAL